MKIHQNKTILYQTVTAYDDKSVAINQSLFIRSLLILPEQEPVDWPVRSFDGILQAHFDPVVAADPDILILGTGRQQYFVAPALIAALIRKGIGVECMTSQAACRTYNLLVSEDRKVALALILEDTESN